MGKIIQKARIVEQRIHVNHEVNKTIRKQAYKVFLQNPPRPLPTYETLRQWRNMLLLVGLIMCTIPSVIIVFFNHLLGNHFFYSLPWILDVMTLFIWSFAGSFDRVIHVRWNGQKPTLIDWTGESYYPKS